MATSVATELSKGQGRTNFGHPQSSVYAVKIFFTKVSKKAYSEKTGVLLDGAQVQTNSPWGAKGNVISSTNKTFVEGKKIARDGDRVSIQGSPGTGNITSGSKKWYSN